jgi:hypothetical protein
VKPDGRRGPAVSDVISIRSDRCRMLSVKIDWQPRSQIDVYCTTDRDRLSFDRNRQASIPTDHDRYKSAAHRSPGTSLTHNHTILQPSTKQTQ